MNRSKHRGIGAYGAKLLSVRFVVSFTRNETAEPPKMERALIFRNRNPIHDERRSSQLRSDPISTISRIHAARLAA